MRRGLLIGVSLDVAAAVFLYVGPAWGGGAFSMISGGVGPGILAARHTFLLIKWWEVCPMMRVLRVKVSNIVHVDKRRERRTKVYARRVQFFPLAQTW